MPSACTGKQILLNFIGFQPPKKTVKNPGKGTSKGAAGKKKIAPAPLKSKVAESKKVTNPLFEKRPKNFGIGTIFFLSFVLHSFVN
jgi:hypothetical protein